MSSLFDYLDTYLKEHPLPYWEDYFSFQSEEIMDIKGSHPDELTFLSHVLSELQEDGVWSPVVLSIEGQKRFSFRKKVVSIGRLMCLEDADGCCLDSSGLVLNAKEEVQGTLKERLANPRYKHQIVSKHPLPLMWHLFPAKPSPEQLIWKEAIKIAWLKHTLGATLPLSNPVGNPKIRL